MKKRGLLLAIPLLLLAALAGGWLAAGRPTAGTLASALGLAGRGRVAPLTASGFIEADEATVSSELGGRIVAIHAAEGDAVTEGQVLVELDDAMLAAQIRQAEADLAAAEAALARVRAGVRPETIATAQATLDQALAAETAARVAWEDAAALRDHPQQLELSILAADSQLALLGFQTQQAEALANAAQAGRDLADSVVQQLEAFEPHDTWVLVGSYDLENLPIDWPVPPDLGDGTYYWQQYKLVVHGSVIELWVLVHVELPSDALPTAQYEQAGATYQSWEAWTGLAQAQAATQGAQAYADELAAQKANPLALAAQADAAEAQFRIASAAVAVAQAQVDGLKMGATAEQIAAAEAQVEVARAALDGLHAQASKFTLLAPLSGLVLERPAHPGELATPGAPLLTLAGLERLTLTVYVPETELGRVALGREASVSVDAYPGRVFSGTVIAISDQAEFTPKDVQTREERVNLVFGVTIELPNPDAALKPGMPADAVLDPGGGAP